jgi:hypothetical protein
LHFLVLGQTKKALTYLKQRRSCWEADEVVA